MDILSLITPALAPFCVLLALQALDIVSTFLALRQPGVYEANPILAPLFKQFGALPVMIAAKLAFATYVWYAHASINKDIVWLMCAGYAYVVINNFKLAYPKK